MNSRSGSGSRALLDHPGVERRPHLAVRPVVLRAERGPLRSGRRAGRPEYAGAISEPGTSSGLHDTIRTNGAPAVMQRGERDDVVLDDDVGPHPVEDLLAAAARSRARRR